MAAKTCDNCETVIGETDAKCPKCGVDIAELTEDMDALERTQTALERRRKRNTPAPEPKTEDQPPARKGSFLRNIAGRKRG